MQINARQSLREISEAFNTVFPHLRMDFYYPDIPGEYELMGAIQNLTEPVFLLSHCPPRAAMHISGDLRISELEKRFLDEFGLGMRILIQQRQAVRS